MPNEQWITDPQLLRLVDIRTEEPLAEVFHAMLSRKPMDTSFVTMVNRFIKEYTHERVVVLDVRRGENFFEWRIK